MYGSTGERKQTLVALKSFCKVTYLNWILMQVPCLLLCKLCGLIGCVVMLLNIIV